MKRIPLKNYFILGIILASSIFIVLYINKLYLSTKNNDNILNGFIKEIKTQEIDNYIIENPNFIIYLGYKNNDNKSFEKKFKKLVTKYDLQKDIVFIDISQFNDETFNKFCKKYADKLLKKDSSLRCT